MNRPVLSPSETFSGKSVLITGTTGFVGKVVLEKMLRDLQSVQTIYLLIRGNTQYPDGTQRFLNEVAASSVFDSLRQDQAEFNYLCETKVKCITGEVTEPQFGLSDTEFNQLALKVDIIINSAASVNFREEVDQALKINTLCLHNIVAFSDKAGGIPVLQVSTCYVNGYHKGNLYEENVAPAGKDLPWNPKGYFEIEELIDRLQIQINKLYASYSGDKLADKLVDYGIAQAQRYGWNDTYTFTKWMGEQLLRKQLQGRPLTILRPSIVESAFAEPTPGWIEGVKVADAIIMAYARGKVNLFPGRAAGVADVIPVDMVANSIILSAAEQLADVGIPAHRVYQCCSGAKNPLVVKKLVNYVVDEARENYQKYPKLILKKPEQAFVLVPRSLFLAGMKSVKTVLWVMDIGAKLIGKQSEFSHFEKIKVTSKLSTVFSFYTSPNYIFHNEKLMSLFGRLSPEDQSKYSVDTSLIDWKRYWRENHLAGLNRFSLDERKVIQLKSKKIPKKSKAA